MFVWPNNKIRRTEKTNSFPFVIYIKVGYTFIYTEREKMLTRRRFEEDANTARTRKLYANWARGWKCS